MVAGFPAGITAAPCILPASSPQPVVPLDYDIRDSFTDEFLGSFGVPVLLTTVAVLPPSSPPLISQEYVTESVYPAVYGPVYGTSVPVIPAPPVLPGTSPR